MPATKKALRRKSPSRKTPVGRPRVRKQPHAFTVRMEQSLFRQIRRKARANGVSIQAFINTSLERQVKPRRAS